MGLPLCAGQEMQLDSMKQQALDLQELQEATSGQVGASLQSLQGLHDHANSLHTQMASHLALEVSIPLHLMTVLSQLYFVAFSAHLAPELHGCHR